MLLAGFRPVAVADLTKFAGLCFRICERHSRTLDFLVSVDKPTKAAFAFNSFKSFLNNSIISVVAPLFLLITSIWYCFAPLDAPAIFESCKNKYHY